MASQYSLAQVLSAGALAGLGSMPQMTRDQVASLQFHAVSCRPTLWTAPSMGEMCAMESSVGTLLTGSTLNSMARSDSSLTKSPFQYHCKPLGRSGSNRPCRTGNGMGPIQSRMGG